MEMDPTPGPEDVWGHVHQALKPQKVRDVTQDLSVTVSLRPHGIMFFFLIGAFEQCVPMYTAHVGVACAYPQGTPFLG